MLRSRLLPFNVDILNLTPDRLKNLSPITSIEFFQSANGDLHDEGLFSIPIFGRVGSEERDERFAYIDVKLEILHPVIYHRLMQLKQMYKNIIGGSQHAIWDDKIKDFIPSDEVRGSTGYTFFMKHWRKIEFTKNDSLIRGLRIQLIEKFRSRATTSKILVMPAGLRDIERDDDGRVTVGDINSIYRKMISIASTIPDTEGMADDPVHDRARNMLQQSFNELYELIEKMLTGKKGFFQSKWASRGIWNSTRNVITAADLSAEYLGSPSAVRYTETIFGMHQASRMLLPIVIYSIKERFYESFAFGDNKARLIDPKSLTSEIVDIAPASFDRWVTTDGLERVVSSYGEVSLRDKPVMIEGRYIALVYRGPDMTFKVFYDINDLPQNLSRKDVHPITLVELMYISMYDKWSNYYALTTRYPVTGQGSIFPASMRVRTTTVGEIRKELGDDWKPIDDDKLAIEYPILPAESYLDSHVINSTRLKGMGGDFDGDQTSATAVMTDEAIDELRRHLKSKRAYADPRGGLKASSALPTIELVALNMLGRV